MIDLTEDTQALWFAHIERGDFLAGLNRRAGGGYTLLYRFRYYVDRKTFDSEDTKNWYKIEGQDLAHMIEVMRQMMTRIKAHGDGQAWELLRGAGSFEQFAQEWMQLPFAHVKLASAAEVKAMQAG